MNNILPIMPLIKAFHVKVTDFLTLSFCGFSFVKSQNSRTDATKTARSTPTNRKREVGQVISRMLPRSPFIVLVVLSLLSSVGTRAQTQCNISSGTSGNGNGGSTVVGQTFTPTCSGDISHVTFVSPNAAAYGYIATIKSGCGGSSFGSGTTAGNAVAGVNTIVFPTPIHVAAGTTYALEFTATIPGEQVWYYLRFNTYPGGTYYIVSGGCYLGYVGDYDLYFSINYVDADADGYSISQGDCDDNNPNIHPDAPEVCDGIDNNCNGQIDEGATTTYYRDADGDGAGNQNLSIQSCSAPPGYVTNTWDCNDNNATVYFNAPEICDGLDNNCNGVVDDGVILTTFYRDADGDGAGDPAVSVQGCSAPAGYVTNSTDCNDGNAAINPNATEVCDGLDNNCNGQTDEGGTTTFYRDVDGDGFGNAALTILGCSAPAGYSNNGSDCNDGNAAINPNAPEVCDGIDNNCNGQIDEGATTTYYRDADGDGAGNQNLSIQSCSAPPGYVTNTWDCNDNNATVYFNAPEICDGLDNNCNGVVDDGVILTTFYRDADGDGAGDPAVSVQGCSAPTGYVTNSTDCNDGNAAINPNATEVCDGLDNNCNGQTDEGCNITTCGVVTGLSTSNITSTSATLNWISPVNPTQWLLQYKTVAPGAKWKDVTPSPATTARTAVITGLTANQSYLWHIKARCGKTWTSYYESVAFKTLAGTSMLVKNNSISMPDEVGATALKLYPNPSNGKVTIELRMTESGFGIARLELVDMKGRIVYMTNASILNGAIQKSIDLSHSLAPGIYTVKISAGNRSYFSKLVYSK